MPRWGRIAPGAYTLAHYERGWLRGDGLAGVTVCAYLIPQVMAYAEIAGLPAVTGLWAMCAPLAVYAVVGPSRAARVPPPSRQPEFWQRSDDGQSSSDWLAGHGDAAASAAIRR